VNKKLRRIILLPLIFFAVAVVAFLLLPKRPAYEVTLFLTSDTHYGLSPTVAAVNEKTIDAMNALPGAAYPKEIGGVVGIPRGVAVLGDLTDDAATLGQQFSWRQFTADFGVNGEGRLRFPAYELPGNHDGGENQFVRQGIRERNRIRPGLRNVSANGINYSWDWAAVHFVSLGLFAGSDGDVVVNPWGRHFDGPWRLPGHSLEFLEEDLAGNVGRSGRPVVLLQHYGWDVWGLGWWSDRERQALSAAIKGYNVIAFFWGHTHVVQRLDVDGIPTFCVGSSQADPLPGSFLVVRIRPKEMIVAERKPDSWGYAARIPLKKPIGVGPQEDADKE
jgi:3',5'-cyclic AMP phosphodiesterase CpdA